MGPSRKKKNAAPQIDFSSIEATGDSSRFEVDDYDYETGISKTDVRFENDLLYLLDASPDEESVNQPETKVIGPRKKAAKKIVKDSSKQKFRANVKRREITADIDDIVFSSDDEEANGNAEPAKEVIAAKNQRKEKGPKPKAAKLKAAGKEKTPRVHENGHTPLLPESKDDGADGLKKSDDISGNKHKETARKMSHNVQVDGKRAEGADLEAVGDETTANKVIVQGEDGDEKQKEQTSTKPKPSRKQKRNKKTLPAGEEGVLTESTPSLSKEKTPSTTGEGSPGAEEENCDANHEEKQSNEQTPTKSKRNRRLKKKAGKLESNEEGASRETTPSSMKETIDAAKENLSGSKNENAVPSVAVYGKKRSLAAATAVSDLPEIQPNTTIIGLSHQQILHMKLTDVKIKTLLSASSLSKNCRNVLSFVQRETEGVFQDAKKRAAFVDLCVSVALHESSGFNGMTLKYPGMTEWLAQHDELTLEHTRTKLTLSKKSAHTNNFDYTVFSYMGHIILWAQYLEFSNGLDTISKRLELGVTEKEILSCLGGYHLWDKIRRNPKTINTKRWKHIQKFRQNFAFEQNQFVLVLRYMRLGIELP